MKPRIRILSVGYGNAGLLGKETLDALLQAQQVVLRTDKNDLTAWLKTHSVPFVSLDSLYETAEDFDSLCVSIASFLWMKAETSPVTYAVTDLLSDGSVSALFREKPENGEVDILPGVSLASLYLPSFRSAVPDADLLIVSAQRFLHAPYDPDGSLLITELDSALLAGEIKLRLAQRLPDEWELLFMRDDSSRKQIQLYELDRQREYDHRTALYVAACPSDRRRDFTLADLPYILRLARTRAPETSQETRPFPLKPSLRETADRCMSAMEAADAEALKVSLGDLLAQCLVRASAAEDYDEFTISDMLSSLTDRLRGENGRGHA